MANKPLPLDYVLGSSVTDKRIDILRSMTHVGSISEAARANQVSYKAAWQAIETLSNLAGVPLIEKNVGGSGGGGARLTKAGVEVLEAADLLQQARAQTLALLRSKQKVNASTVSGLAGVGIRTSMRNQLPCTIAAVHASAGSVRVEMTLTDGQRLVSKITRESLELLGLERGMPVIAMCKATAVKVAPAIVAIGEINLLNGQITRRVGLKQDGQVSVGLCQGLQIAGFAQPGATLKLRQHVQAAIDESAVVIALTS